MSEIENGHTDKHKMLKEKLVISHLVFLEKRLSTVLQNETG